MAVTSYRSLVESNFGRLLLGADAELAVASYTMLDANSNVITGATSITSDTAFIRINGTNFGESSVAVINGQEVSTTYESVTSLKITAPNVYGDKNLYVKNGNFFSTPVTLPYNTGLTADSYQQYTNEFKIPTDKEFSLDLRFIREDITGVAYSVGNVATLPTNTSLSSSGFLTGNVASSAAGQYTLTITSDKTNTISTTQDVVLNFYQETGDPTSFEIETLLKNDNRLYDISPSTYFRSISRIGNFATYRTCVQISDDGTRMIATFLYEIYLFELAVPFDLKSAICLYSTNAFNGLSTSYRMHSFCVSRDGRTLYMSSGQGTTLDIYRLGDYWDVSNPTLLYSQSFANLSSVGGQSVDLDYNETYLYVWGDTSTMTRILLDASTKIPTGTVQTITNVQAVGTGHMYLEKVNSTTPRIYFDDGIELHMQTLSGTTLQTAITVDRQVSGSYAYAGTFFSYDHKKMYVYGSNTSVNSTSGLSVQECDVRHYTNDNSTIELGDATLSDLHFGGGVMIDNAFPSNIFSMQLLSPAKLSFISEDMSGDYRILQVNNLLNFGQLTLSSNTVNLFNGIKTMALDKNIIAANWTMSGKILMLFNDATKQLLVYSVSTPYDPTTATLFNTIDTGLSGSVNSILSSFDGTKIYLHVLQDGMYTATFTSLSESKTFVKITGNVFDNETSLITSMFSFNESGTKLFYTQQNTSENATQESTYQIRVAALNTPWSIESVDQNNIYRMYGGSNYCGFVGNDTLGSGMLATVEKISGYAATSNVNYAIKFYPVDLFRTSLTPGLDTSYATAYELQIDETGTKLYVGDLNVIYYIKLSTPWDLTSGTFVNRITVATNSYGFYFRDDGLKFYSVSASDDKVHEYDVEIPWDISTIQETNTFSVGSQESNPFGLYFGNNGTKMYVIGTSGDDVNEYNLSTAWDITTANFQSAYATGVTNPYVVKFSTDGTLMFVSVLGIIYVYDLALAWASSTATLSYNVDILTDFGDSGRAFTFSSDGLKLYTADYTNDVINYYTLSTAWDLTTLTQVNGFSGAEYSTTVSDSAFANNKQYLFTVDTLEKISKYEMTTPGDLNTLVLKQESDWKQFNEDSTIKRIFIKEDGTKMYTFGQVGDVLYEYNFAGDPFDLYGIEYVQSVALLNSVGASITVPADLWLSNDGSNVYLLNSSDDTLYQYSLSTPWDLSTLTSYGNLVVGTEDSTPFGFAFSSDGFTLYYVGGTKDRLIKYTLTTAWDITTATFSLESTGRIYTDRENINLQIGTPSVIIDYEDKEFYSTNYNHITKYKIIEKTV